MISEGHPLRKELSEWVLRENNVRYKEPSASSGSAGVVRKESQPEAEPAPDSKDCRQAGSASKPGSPQLRSSYLHQLSFQVRGRKTG